jgi:hypothetical protein
MVDRKRVELVTKCQKQPPETFKLFPLEFLQRRMRLRITERMEERRSGIGLAMGYTHRPASSLFDAGRQFFLQYQ